MRAEITARLETNLTRVRSLVSYYSTSSTTGGGGRRGVLRSDVLRAAVVLLHASLEDFLRSIEHWRLPGVTPAQLDGIPIHGTSEVYRNEKIGLVQLAQHRGKNVDDVIRESIKAYLDRTSYNDTSQIVAHIKRIEIDPSPLSEYFAILAEMIERRHHIVHQADRNTKRGVGHHGAKSISIKKLDRWIRAVESFCGDVLGRIP